MVRRIVNAVLVRDGTLLLARRGPQRSAYPGCWSFPGGHLEPAETLEAALIREASEEIGVMPTTFHPLCRMTDSPGTADPATYDIFVVTSWNGEACLRGGEHVELRWLTTQAAADLRGLALESYEEVFRAIAGRMA